MFTGIVQGVAKVVAVRELDEFRVHIVEMPLSMRAGLEIGASVAHNGVCLTVTSIEGDNVSFDLMRETLRLTNLGAITPGQCVNIERAARFGDEIGGHSMSGHIISMADVVAIEEDLIIVACGLLFPNGLAASYLRRAISVSTALA